MTQLAMTPNRSGLLAQVEAGHVFRDAIGESYISADRKVTAQIAEMRAAGWVELDTSRLGHFWRVTPLGRAHRQLRICNYGTHMVAETGPADDPRVIGEALRRPVTGHGKWLVEVGDGSALCRNAAGALAELRRRAAALLAEELAEAVTA